MLRNLIKYGLLIILIAGMFLPIVVFAQDVVTEGAGRIMGTMLGGPLGGEAGAQLAGAKFAIDGTSIFDGVLSVAGKSLSFFIFAINYITGYIAAVVFAFAGFLLQIGLELNARLLVSPVVQIGWGITRDIANLGFVIAIIMIAFARMLRVDSYGSNKILANLIVVALLVNFSLTFAGVFIDASNIVSNFFIQQVAPSGVSGINVFAENLASAFQLQRLHEVKDITDMPEFGGLGDFSASMLGLLASVFFVALFTSIGATIMLIIAGLMLVRYVALSILLILLPLAMVTYIFPALQKNWQKWVKNFTDWLVFLPATLFFLYLTILITTNFKDNPNWVKQITASVEAGTSSYLDQFLVRIADTMQIFAEMIVVLILLSGGLIVAKSFSLQFSNNVIGAVEGGKKWLLGKIGKGARAPVRWGRKKVLESDTAKKAASGLSRTKFPGLRRAGSALSNRITASKGETDKEVENYRKKHLSNLPEARDVHSYIQSNVVPDALRPVVLSAEIAELTRRGKIEEVLDDIPDSEKEATISQWLKSAKSAGIEKEVIQIKPEWASRIGETVEKIVSKIENINKVSKDSFKVPEVVSAMNQDQLNKVQGGLKKVIKETMKKELDRIQLENNLTNDNLDSFVRESGRELRRIARQQNQTVEQVIALREQAINQLKSNKNISDEDFKKLKSLVNLRRTAINNPSWQT